MQDVRPMLNDLLFGEQLLQESLNSHFAFFNASWFMVGNPSGLRQSILEIYAILSPQILLQLQQLPIPQENLLFDGLDAYLHDINSILEHIVAPLISAQYLHIRQEVQSRHLP